MEASIAQLLAPYWDAMMFHQGVALAAGAWVAAFRICLRPFIYRLVGMIERGLKVVQDSPSKGDDRWIAKAMHSPVYGWFSWASNYFLSVPWPKPIESPDEPASPKDPV